MVKNNAGYGTSTSTKENLVLTIMNLESTDSRLAQLDLLLRGSATNGDDENLLIFKDLCKKLGYDQSWLRRLGVHETCAIRLAGGKRYKKSEVITFLQSKECERRVEKIRKARTSSNCKAGKAS